MGQVSGVTMTDIESILNQWGEWQRSGAGQNLGYPGCDLVHRSVFAGQPRERMHRHMDAEKMDKCILSLEKKTQDVLKWHYIELENYTVIAQNCRVERRTIKRWIDGAKERLGDMWE